MFGLSDSVTKFTSSVGKGEELTLLSFGLLTLAAGLSAATFDSEYQAKRRMAQRRNRPRHAMFELETLRLIDFLTDFLDMVSLLVERPLLAAWQVRSKAWWWVETLLPEVA